MNSPVVILSSSDSEVVGTELTMPVARDRSSQVDFLRELSRARRTESTAAEVTNRPDEESVPVALRHEDQPVERPWTDGFRSLSVSHSDAGIPEWAAASLAPALNPDNWFTEPEIEPEIEPDTAVAVEPDTAALNDLDEPESAPMATWWTTDPGPGLFDIAPELLASPTLLVGPFDPANDWAPPEVLVPREADPELAPTVEPTADIAPAPAPAPAPVAPAPVAAAPVAPEGPSPVVGRTLANRPPVLDQDTPVLVHCRGLAASRLTRGKSRTILTSIDLDVRVGEVVVIGGRSGSGKTTLLECLAGLHPTESGELTVDGRNVAAPTDAGLAELRANAVGFVPQDSELLTDLTAIENIELPLLLHGWSPADARAEAEAAVSLLGLDRPGERPMDLAAGERRRVAIARAIVGEPTILWCDEPTAGLDPETAATIYELLFELCHDGLSIVAVSHDPVLVAHATTSYELVDGSLRPVPPLR